MSTKNREQELEECEKLLWKKRAELEFSKLGKVKRTDIIGTLVSVTMEIELPVFSARLDQLTRICNSTEIFYPQILGDLKEKTVTIMGSRQFVKKDLTFGEDPNLQTAFFIERKHINRPDGYSFDNEVVEVTQKRHKFEGIEEYFVILDEGHMKEHGWFTIKKGKAIITQWG